MKVLRKSEASGKLYQRDLPITKPQLLRWQIGGAAHKVFPYLTADEREFLISGVSSQEWDEINDDWEIHGLSMQSALLPSGICVVDAEIIDDLLELIIKKH